MLKLQGVPLQMRGFERIHPSCLLRLRRHNDRPMHEVDVALLRSPEEAKMALENSFDSAVFIASPKFEEFPEAALFSRAATLPFDFDYLAEGDVISLRTAQNRIRALYRRGSNHNSFLVTERCNHYCLMCSQPPRDINDGHLVDELLQAIPMMSRETLSVVITRGEPT